METLIQNRFLLAVVVSCFVLACTSSGENLDSERPDGGEVTDAMAPDTPGVR